MEEQLSAEAKDFLEGKTDILPSDAQEITSAEAEKLEEKAENKEALILPISGIKVEMDLENSTGETLRKIRKQCINDEDLLGLTMVAEVATFDGEKKTAYDILDMDMDDVLAIEEFYAKKKAQRILAHRK